MDLFDWQVFIKITVSKSKWIFFSGPDTPLPDLNIVVTDEDVGKNAEFDLVSNLYSFISYDLFLKNILDKKVINFWQQNTHDKKNVNKKYLPSLKW